MSPKYNIYNTNKQGGNKQYLLDWDGSKQVYTYEQAVETVKRYEIGMVHTLWYFEIAQ